MVNSSRKTPAFGSRSKRSAPDGSSTRMGATAGPAPRTGNWSPRTRSGRPPLCAAPSPFPLPSVARAAASYDSAGTGSFVATAR